jgi:predicted Zn finger-like uncharacterized protein
MPIEVQCPACRQSYLLADNQAGKRVRCKSCSEVFAVPAVEQIIDVLPVEQVTPRRRGAADDYDDRPRRRLATSPGLPPWVWIVIGVGGFLVITGVAVAVVLAVGGNKVTKENYDKLRAGMTEAEVRAILGGPDEELDPTRAATQLQQNPFLRANVGNFGGLFPSAKVLLWKRGRNFIAVTLLNDHVAGLMSQFQN